MRPLVLALVLLLPLAPLPDAEAARPPWAATTLDVDGDGVHDALEEGPAPRAVLLSYAAPPTAAERAAVAAAGARVLAEIRIVPVLVVEPAGASLAALAALPGVVLVEEDIPLRPLLDESRRLVGAEDAWRTHRVSGKGVTIAVLDTGIDPAHPDFEGRILARYDATAPTNALATLLGQDPPTVPGDADGHGTHVAGIAAGSGKASGGRYAGVAPGAGLLDVKVFDAKGDSTSSQVLAAIDWVVARKERFDVRILQMSLGGRSTDGTDALSRGVDAATLEGLLTVAAAGNTGPDPKTVAVPGTAASALTVAAVDKRLAIAKFSARGPTTDGRLKPDLAAPGVAITSAQPTSKAPSGYGPKDGTSMAAPHAAGVAALVWEANASLTPTQVKLILLATARGAGNWDAARGWGDLDAEAAVEASRDPDALPQDRLQAILAGLPGLDPGPLQKLADEGARLARGIPAPAALAVAALVLVAGRRARR